MRKSRKIGKSGSEALIMEANVTKLPWGFSRWWIIPSTACVGGTCSSTGGAAAGVPLHGPDQAEPCPANLIRPDAGGFLYGEQIGRHLSRRRSIEPLLVCTDCEPVLAERVVTRAGGPGVLPEGSARDVPGDAAAAEV